MIECAWAEENLITSTEFRLLRHDSKKNIVRHETNYNKFCK